MEVVHLSWAVYHCHQIVLTQSLDTYLPLASVVAMATSPLLCKVTYSSPSPVECQSLTGSLLSSNASSEKGLFISRLLQTHQTTLTHQIQPQDVAKQLYNLGLLDTAGLDRACAIEETDRAKAIVLFLQKKLRYKPELFSDVCAALKKAGVEIIQQIKGV